MTVPLENLSFSTDPNVSHNLIAETLTLALATSFSFAYEAGGVTPVTSGTTGSRTVPQAVIVNCFRGRMHVAVANSEAFDAPEGAAFCIPAGQRHEIAFMSDQGVSRWSHVNMRILGTVDLLSLFELPVVYSAATGNAIGDINAALVDIADAPVSVARSLAMEGYGRLLASLVVGKTRLRPHAGRLIANIHRLRPVLEYVADNLADADIDGMSEVACLPASRFHAVFRDLLGIPPGTYLQTLRMRRAQQLLLTTDLPINEVARLAGHADPFHFSRLFRKLYGTSPKAYRSSVRAQGLGG